MKLFQIRDKGCWWQHNPNTACTLHSVHSVWQPWAALNLLKLYCEFQLNKIEVSISAGLQSTMAIDVAVAVVTSHFIQLNSKKLHKPA